MYNGRTTGMQRMCNGHGTDVKRVSVQKEQHMDENETNRQFRFYMFSRNCEKLEHKPFLLLPEAQVMHNGANNRERRCGSERKRNSSDHTMMLDETRCPGGGAQAQCHTKTHLHSL